MLGSQVLARAIDPLLGAPPGEEPNFINPYSRGQRIVISSIILTSFAFVFVLARVFVKGFITKRFGWDDVFCVAAMAFSITRTVMSVILVDVYGIGVHIWNFNPKHIVGAHNLQFAEDMVYLLGIMFAKLSILTLYVNIFHIKRGFRWVCYGMMAVTVAYCTTFFFIIAFSCHNAYDTWHFSIEADCIPITEINVAIGAVNIVTDLIIMILPIPVIWKLHLKKPQKWGLLAVFGTGLFVLVSTIVREVIVVTTNKEVDQSWVVVDEVIWLTVELNIGIICISLPALSPMYTRALVSKFNLSSLRNLLSFTGGKSRSKLGSMDGTKESKQDSSGYTDGVYLVNMASSHAAAQGDARSSGDPQDYAYETNKNGIQVRHKVEQHITQVPSRGHDIV